MDSFVTYLQSELFMDRILTAIGLICVLWGVQYIVTKVFKRSMKNAQNQKQKTMLSVLVKAVQLVVFIIGVMMLLEVFGVTATPMVAIASAISVALGLGAQRFIQDLLAGFFILSENHFALGDVVSINGITGVVEGVTLRATRIRNSVTGEQYILSNGDIKMVTNMSRDYRKAVVDVLVPYHFDMNTVIEYIEQIIETVDVEEPLLTAPIFDGVTKLEERYYVLRVSCRTYPNTNWSVETMLRRKIVTGLRSKGITLSAKTPEELREYETDLAQHQ